MPDGQTADRQTEDHTDGWIDRPTDVR